MIQTQGAPYSMSEEVAEIYAATGETLSRIPKGGVRKALDKVLDRIKSEHPEVLKEIETSGELSDENKAKLDAVMQEVIL